MDLETYQQLLSGQEGAAAAAFFQPPPHPQAPTLGVDDQWAVDPASYVAADGFLVPPQPMQLPGGGSWEGNGDGFAHQGGGDWAGSSGVAQGEAWAAAEPMMLGGDVFPGNDLLMFGGGGVPDLPVGGAQDLLMDGVDLSKFFSDEAVNSLWASANEQPMVPADELSTPPSNSSDPTSQVGAADSPGMMSQMPTYPPAMDCPQTAPAEPNQQASLGMMPQTPAHPPPMDYRQPAPVNIQQAMPDDEEVEVAQMVQTAVRCDGKVSTEWSEEENRVLREGLSRFAGQDNVTKCFSIASMLANKTVLDVAYRIRWLSDLEKKRAAKQAQLEQEKPAGGKVTKGKGNKGATRKNNKYPLSKEVLNSKSAKDLIRDNDRLMDKIEETLRTGQVKDSPDYFYYVKMNMDALLNKVPDLSTVMEGLSVDHEDWADVLKDRSSSA